MRAGAWEEMLAEFRALGGVADNICQRDGAYGRGIFPIDNAKQVLIRIPERLLFDTHCVELRDGALRIKPDASIGDREKAFFATYQDFFSWGGGGSDEIARIFEQTQKLPEGLRHTLADDFNLGEWLRTPASAHVTKRFIDSRCARYGTRTVIFPLIELLNHSPTGIHYRAAVGLELRGTASGELFGRYTDADAFGLFANWGFACAQPQAFSMALKSSRSEFPVDIGRDLRSLSTAQSFWAPSASRTGNGLNLGFLMLGNKRFPHMSKGIFYKIMREAGARNYEEAFDLIQRANFTWVSNLLGVLEKIDGDMAQTLRQVARFQLQALAFYMAVRET